MSGSRWIGFTPSSAPNASGKSTYLDVVRFLGDMVQPGGLDAAIDTRTQNWRDLVWMGEEDHWPPEDAKPPDPKEAMEDALRESRLPHSSSIFRELAESVSLRGCEDDAFQRFRQILQEWFPPSWKQ